MAGRDARPVKHTLALAALVCRAIGSSPYGLRRIVRELPDLPTVDTVMRWLDADAPGFREQYARACDLRADILADQCLDIADESENDGERISEHEDVHATEQVARSKLRVDTRRWLAGKLRPKKYGDAVRVGGDENAPPIQHKVTVEFI